MSLQAWYPFNGNYENLGLGDLDLTVQTSPTYTTGKVTGQAINTGLFKWTPEQSSKILNNKALSVCFWLKPTASTSVGGAVFGQTYSARRFCIFTYPTLNDLHLDWRYNESGSGFYNTVETGFFPINQWTHCTVTFEYPNLLKIYKNGILHKSIVGYGTMNFSSFAYDTFLYFDTVNRYINDFRVYNHCLSPKEVKEIAKGLMLHYPLSSPYDIGFANKYSGTTAEGKAQESALTVNKLENERGYNYKMSYTGTGGNHWNHIYFPNFEFTPNKTYQYSCKVRLNKYSHSSIYFEMRGARVNNDWARPSAYSFSNIPMDGQWHALSIPVTVPATFDLSGTTKTASPLIEFWTGNLSTSGTVYEMDFDLKDVQVVECDGPVEFIENEFLDNTIYDTSGYKNNGIITEANKPVLGADSPRNQNSYHFKDLQNLHLPVIAYENMNKGTISFWIKFNEKFLNWSHYLQIANGFNWTGQDADFIIVANRTNLASTVTSTSINIDTCSYSAPFTASLNTWYHIVIEWDADNYLIKHYVNGSLLSTFDDSSYKRLDTYRDNHYFNFIGNGYLKTAYNGDFNISDFRIYATCLSDSDIQELYNKPISIDNQGVMFAVEAVEESATGPQFFKTGTVEATAISALSLYDMETKVLDDGSAWARILHHNNRAGTVLFTTSNVLDIQTTDLYSRLKILEQFRDDNGAFEFMAIQPDIDDTIYRWKQTNNPTQSGLLSGYINIENGQGGLVYGPVSYTLMSASGTVNNWYSAVGCYTAWHEGIPSFAVNGGVNAGTLDFYVRIDTVSPNKEFKLYNKYIECNDIIEC